MRLHWSHFVYGLGCRESGSFFVRPILRCVFRISRFDRAIQHGEDDQQENGDEDGAHATGETEGVRERADNGRHH